MTQKATQTADSFAKLPFVFRHSSFPLDFTDNLHILPKDQQQVKPL